MYIAVPARFNASLTIPRLDFWALPDYRLTGYLTERVEKAFYKRCPTEERPTFILESEGGDPGNPHEDASRQPSRPGKTPRNEASDICREDLPEPGRGAGAKQALDVPRSQARGKTEKHDANLGMALHNVFWLQWWTAVMKSAPG